MGTKAISSLRAISSSVEIRNGHWQPDVRRVRMVLLPATQVDGKLFGMYVEEVRPMPLASMPFSLS